MNDVTKVLIEARDLISDPARWTQGVHARDAKGELAFWSDPTAVCWCASGAIRKAAGTGPGSYVLVHGALDELEYVMGNCGLATFNDDHTHADVLELFDRAIAGEGA